MEVHHHPEVEKKNLKGYLLEGLMIFIAVMLGFFAESFREHLADNGKEKEFVASLKEDLVSDSAALKQVIPSNEDQFQKLDSLYTLLDLAREGKPVPVNRIYYFTFRYAFGLVAFSANERTITQIKSTGAFSLIKSKACRDSLTQYYELNDFGIANNRLGLKEWTDDLDKAAQKIFDFANIKTFWFTQDAANVFLNDSLHLEMSSDKQALKEFGNKVRSLMMMINALSKTERWQQRSGRNLIDLLNKEYDL